MWFADRRRRQLEESDIIKYETGSSIEPPWAPSWNLYDIITPLRGIDLDEIW